MKFNLLGSAAIISLALMSNALHAKNDAVTYKNTRGSTLELQFSSDDTLTGTFTTAVATKECQQAVGMKRPVVGYIVNDVITVSVSYPTCGTVLTFIGNINKDKGAIDATAILARPTHQVYAKGAGVQFLSHDEFKRV